MIHCSECNATLHQFDTRCWCCDVALSSRKQKGPKAFCKAVNAFFSFFTVLAVISVFFSDITWGFKLCAISALLVVRLVKHSADEMAKLGKLDAFKVVLSRRKSQWGHTATPRWQLALEKCRRP